MQYDVFISYSRKDSEVAMRICEAFDKVGITYFIDLQGISGGFEFPTVIAEAIINSKIFLYLASENSYESKFTQAEITFAFNKKKRGNILPYIIDGSNLPLSLEFVFSAINWRRIENDPIDSVLTEDLLKLLGKKSMSKQNLQLKEQTVTIETSSKASTPSPTNTLDDHEYVDLGLSVKWATCNVGASSPEECGDYFAWGETEPKSEYKKETYKYYGKNKKTYIDIGKDISGTKYDVARAKWGGNWRMPRLDEMEELKAKCTWTWTSQGGHNGYRVTGPNGNSIFLPAAGYRDGKEVNYRGSNGNYWSGTLKEDYRSYACLLNFYSLYRSWNNYDYRYGGRTVRPVTE